MIARNGVNFGTEPSGTGDQWFQAPANPVDGLYFPGYAVDDAAADLGDSAVTETNGLGGCYGRLTCDRPVRWRCPRPMRRPTAAACCPSSTPASPTPPAYWPTNSGMIPTGVPRVAVGFGTSSETWLDTITVEQARDYIASGQFGKGSMEPKV
ncbi:hypothetical protein MSAR_47520 [Mycolicibacterium sarraceniae]|uniref:Uncharacterized protein n=1 Tax=Mycolicibacterium sarraceniae TaxID=1534348 RepID=A0A7I7T0L9_9MYCO|nr:hypothetical protein MSAR_47520 [Mycolicibacterium sarraceniae]